MKHRRRQRRAKLLPPATAVEPAIKKQVHLDALPAPNHTVASFDITRRPGVVREGRPRFPLMRLMRPEEPGGGDAFSLLFIDPIYEAQHWTDRDQDCPPSWMDPELFIRMVLTDPRVRPLYVRYRDSLNDVDKASLLQLVRTIFAEKYLPYLKKQFDTALPILTDWVIGHHADFDALPKKSTKRR